MREIVSGGNLLIGCNTFRKDGIIHKISCALASRLSIYRLLESELIRMVDRCVLASDSNEAAGNHRREKSLSYPGLFQAEFLVQRAEEVWDGEVSGGGCFKGHGVASEGGIGG
jgi:hypothetical protein